MTLFGVESGNQMPSTRIVTTKCREQPGDGIVEKENNMNMEEWDRLKPPPAAAGYCTNNNQRHLTPDDRVYNWLSQSPDIIKDVNLRNKNSDLVRDRDSLLVQQYPHAKQTGNDVIDDTCKRSNRRKNCKKSRRKQLYKTLCWAGWIVCCPIWTLGFCLRESPSDDEDGEYDSIDVCWPCTYDTSVRNDSRLR